MSRVPGFVLAAAVMVGCRYSTSAPPAAAPQPHVRAVITNAEARSIVCSGLGEETCLAACPDALSSDAHAACLIDLLFAGDPGTKVLARSLYEKHGVLLGANPDSSVDGYRGETISLFPALPVGSRRHHVAWIGSALESIGRVVDALAVRARRPIAFEPIPKAIAFFETEYARFPSAYGKHEVIAYNLEGPLHRDPHAVRETLIHELFHLADERSGFWSESALEPTYRSILDRCQEDHECLRPYAPHPSTTEGGTYYAFDKRTGDVREYAAELALRYVLEQEAYLAGGATAAPFKCISDENRVAWALVAETFFGGTDLSPACGP